MNSFTWSVSKGSLVAWFVWNSKVFSRTCLPPVSDWITGAHSEIFGHVVRLSDNTPAHQAMPSQAIGWLTSVFTWKRQPDWPCDKRTDDRPAFATTATVPPSGLCGDKLLVVVTHGTDYYRRETISASKLEICPWLRIKVPLTVFRTEILAG